MTPSLVQVHVEPSGWRNWLQFVKERIQFPIYILVSMAYSLSGMYLVSATPSASSHPEAPKIPDGRLAWTLLTLVLTLACMRIMDDLKDYETDIDAHPDRPLPRGLVKVSEARVAVAILVSILILNGIFLILFNSVVSGVCALAIVLFTICMMYEFGAPEWLSARPLLYAIVHQPVVVLIGAFAVSMTIVPRQYVWDNSSSAVSVATQFKLLSYGQTWHYGLVLLGSSFAYEVCRKLDPTAHVSLGYYLQRYGPLSTFVMVAVPMGVAAWSAFVLGLGPLLWPFEGFLLLSLAALLISGNHGKAFKLVELVSTINALIHALGISILAWAGWLGMSSFSKAVYGYWI